MMAGKGWTTLQGRDDPNLSFLSRGLGLGGNESREAGVYAC